MILYDQNVYSEIKQYIIYPCTIYDVIYTTLHTVIRPQYWCSSIHSVIIVGHLVCNIIIPSFSKHVLYLIYIYIYILYSTITYTS